MRLQFDNKVSRERAAQVLLAPHATEKTGFVSDNCNHVVFRVKIDATKFEIKQAVETFFKVKVKSVKTCRVRAQRIERFGRLKGFSSRWKKAYVALAPGHEISFAEIN